MTDLAQQARNYYLWFNLPLQVLAFLAVIFLPVNWFAAVIFYVVIYWAGIQAGSHKLFSHRSWTPRWPWLRYLLAYFSYFGMMGGPVVWAGLHRWHHANSDQDRDPHSPRHGLWHAYAGWLLDLPSFPITLCRDHFKDRLLMRMDHHCREIVIATVVLVAMIDISIAAALLVAMTITFHAEMAVNCFLHGRMDGEWMAKNSAVLAPISGGSTLHANHHQDPAAFDFRQRWYEIDPSSYIVRLLSR